MILLVKRITKALISQRGSAGWSAPLLFANPQDRFSRVDAHISYSSKVGYPSYEQAYDVIYLDCMYLRLCKHCFTEIILVFFLFRSIPVQNSTFETDKREEW